MLYQVIFDDKSTFEGGNSYRTTKWNEIPDKPIKQINFQLPDGNIFTLRGYESYNHMVEATQDFYGMTGKKKGQFIVRFQYLRGKVKNKIISFRISLFQTTDSKYKIGDITRRELEWGKDDNGKSSKGWKQGIK